MAQKLGELLKSTREEQGLALEDVERDLRIRLHLIQALEDNNFSVFPSPVIVRGMVRNYAQYLNLDPIQALTLYDGNGVVPVKGQRLTPNGIQFMNLSMAPRPFITWDLIIGGILFLLVVGGASYFAYTATFQTDLVPAPAANIAVPTPASESALLLPTVTPVPTETPTPLPPTDTPTPQVYSGVTVQLVIQQPSWIQILVDDVKAFEGILQVGESQQWTGERRIAIRAGNAGGVEVIVNGTSRGLMGVEGQVADQVWEKVDNPATLTPQPADVTETPPSDEASPAVDTSSEPSEGTPLPADSAPEAQPASDTQ